METFVGDTVNIVLKTGIDLTGFANLYIKFRRPNGTTGKWVASISVDNDTWMEYTTLETDLDMGGEWAVQADAKDAGVDLHGKWIDFFVYVPITDTTTPPTTVPPTTLAPTTI